MTSDRIELRLKKLKELVTTKGKGGLSPRRGPTGRTIDSSKLANVMVVDIARYSRMKKCRGGTDMRIPIVNLRDGYNNKLFLSERVSEILLSRYFLNAKKLILVTPDWVLPTAGHIRMPPIQKKPRRSSANEKLNILKIRKTLYRKSSKLEKLYHSFTKRVCRERFQLSL